MSLNVAEFYEGKNVLVFGSTTFPGKVLIEKLLSSCPNVEKIYCPIPCPIKTVIHDSTAMDTFAEIYTTKLFDHVRRINDKFHEKIVPFNINMLLSSSASEIESIEQDQSQLTSWKNLQSTIDVCFYIPDDSVGFEEENLKNTIQTIVVDLKDILTFLKTCTQLKSIAYLSSIYANIGEYSTFYQFKIFIETEHIELYNFFYNNKFLHIYFLRIERSLKNSVSFAFL